MKDPINYQIGVISQPLEDVITFDAPSSVVVSEGPCIDGEILITDLMLEVPLVVEGNPEFHPEEIPNVYDIKID